MVKYESNIFGIYLNNVWLYLEENWQWRPKKMSFAVGEF